MELDHYELKAGSNLMTFQFLSKGKRGRIVKIVQFQKMDIANLYNLSFGDANPGSNKLNDRIVTNNGDAEKVLATVVAALYAFTDHYPGAWVYATGSTHSRTRLYRMGINKYFNIARTDFDILGEYENEWEWYELGKKYQAFAVRKKMVNLNNEGFE